ncbi:exodeoxyribonuclease III [Desulfobaculum bizertense]|uniref:Exodeoxyribonuclease-3 n=1 Tax=Desulfobaculum bizertense DSM 18034 TaxID=1121442 RepID=A0A1T4WHN8_9BACT|nr:exodeoxyribonuclease III [Desulfobaculum bizertense]SKA76689.1 exodeoxyribonuclease-3 [Desulfobaculum bizertense DSM 18034]
MNYRLRSWNVNGFRAIQKKGFWDWLNSSDSDLVGLQEIKADPSQLREDERNPAGWDVFWNPARSKKGYSGTAILSKIPPLSVRFGLADESYCGEGRTVCVEFEEFYLYNIYFPNGGMGDDRLQYKLGFYDAFLEDAEELRKKKPIVVCGDFNTAHKPIDLARPKDNEKTTGFLPIERAWIDKLVAHGYLDTLRMFDQEPALYTWWSYRTAARVRNVGWRIDYFFVSEELRDNVKAAWIDSDVMGSDHCPLGIELEF